MNHVLSLMVFGLSAGASAAIAQDPMGVRIIRQSEPKVVNQAKFQVVVGSNPMKVDKSQASKPMDVALHITNVSKSNLVFETFDTFGITLHDQDGKHLPRSGGRDWTGITRPIEIPPGVTYALRGTTTLAYHEKKKSLSLSYEDGTGRIVTYMPLHPGHYTLRFIFNFTSGDFQTKARSLDNSLLPETLRFWRGELQSHPIDIDLDVR